MNDKLKIYSTKTLSDFIFLNQFVSVFLDMFYLFETDMFIFEIENRIVSVHTEGYKFSNDEYVNKKNIFSFEIPEKVEYNKIWCKITKDENNKLVATFLLPSEY